MARAPDRNRESYFLGAGFSRSVGLPNTAELLTEVHALAKREGLVSRTTFVKPTAIFIQRKR
jgi:hypothetical protein